MRINKVAKRKKRKEKHSICFRGKEVMEKSPALALSIVIRVPAILIKENNKRETRLSFSLSLFPSCECCGHCRDPF